MSVGILSVYRLKEQHIYNFCDRPNRPIGGTAVAVKAEEPSAWTLIISLMSLNPPDTREIRHCFVKRRHCKYDPLPSSPRHTLRDVHSSDSSEVEGLQRHLRCGLPDGLGAEGAHTSARIHNDARTSLQDGGVATSPSPCTGALEGGGGGVG